MKKRSYFRILGLLTLFGVLPGIVRANVFPINGKVLYCNRLSILADSVPREKMQDDKDGKKKDRGTEKVSQTDDKKGQQEPKVDAKQPEIKEVPKARPKLRPATVGDKIKIKRAPLKIKVRH